MDFKDELIKQVNEGNTKIKVKGLLDRSMLNLTITSLIGEKITLGTLVKDTKIRFQPQYNKKGKWIKMPYRLDSHSNKPLHTHFINDRQQDASHAKTIRDIFRLILGRGFDEGDFTEAKL